MRVVSLTCSNTEIVWSLGASALLVGVDDHSDFPPDVVNRLPRVGPDLDIDVARVAALRPDLVLASLTVPGHERIIERLEREKLPFVATEPISVEDVYADVRKVGDLLGLSERAGAVVSEMRAAFRPRPTNGRRPVVLVEWWPKPVIVPGARSWVTGMLEVAGGRNPLGNEPVKSRPITDEEARAIDPDAVVIAWCGVPFDKYRPRVVSRRPAWQRLRAIEHGRIFPISEAFLGRPSPRLVEGVRALERVVDACNGVT
ncbi:MAG TPA: helical backbone metal receptor [Polyangiaceae bacterium]|nr:helical backbone metal receptor [Polyangiaceae bacterium]